MQKKLILNQELLEITISRLCYQLIENHNDFSESAILGLQPRGKYVADRIKEKLEALLSDAMSTTDGTLTEHETEPGNTPKEETGGVSSGGEKR